MPISATEKNENMKFKKDCFLNFNSENCNTPVFRVYPITRLLELFQSKQNTLVKPQMWDDPFENVLFQQKAKLYTGQSVSFTEMHNSFYGQCWTLNQVESDALWRIYSPNKDSVRVKTTLGKLFDGFYNVEVSGAYINYFIGKINYMTAKEMKVSFENPATLTQIFKDMTGKEAVKTLLLKRKEFDHEKEVRLIYSASSQKYDLSKSIYQYPVEPNELIDELLFDPRFDTNLFSCVKDKLTSIGYKNPISISELYQVPRFDLLI
jgi:hypothetical protein